MNITKKIALGIGIILLIIIVTPLVLVQIWTMGFLGQVFLDTDLSTHKIYSYDCGNSMLLELSASVNKNQWDQAARLNPDLRFNGKKVIINDYSLTLPYLRKQAMGFVDINKPGPDPFRTKTIYLSPQTFSEVEFETLKQCAIKNPNYFSSEIQNAKIETIVAGKSQTAVFPIHTISTLVYGDPFKEFRFYCSGAQELMRPLYEDCLSRTSEKSACDYYIPPNKFHINLVPNGTVNTLMGTAQYELGEIKVLNGKEKFLFNKNHSDFASVRGTEIIKACTNSRDQKFGDIVDIEPGAISDIIR
jgi:hypothetical protein